MLPSRALLAGLLLTGALSTGSAALLIEAASASADSTTTQIITGPAGSGFFGEHVQVLTNGNYVVTDSSFDGAAADVGAVYLYDGATNQVISTLTGTRAGDRVGSGNVQEVGGSNFVVSSSLWANGPAAPHAGAVTWINGVTGLNGPVTAANSLVGSTTNDGVGSFNVAVLTNGNYTVVSPSWDNGGAFDAGAVTFGTGAAGVSGPVGSIRSLVGTVGGDMVGSSYVQPLTNGNYVVRSPYWTLSDLGAATWGSGTTGVSGPVTSTNSIIGGSSGDLVSFGGVTALKFGNYVVSSPYWSNTLPAAAAAGAATWGNGSGGTHGVVTSSNSLVGSNDSDQIGDGGIVDLTSDAYVVNSPRWGATNFGAVTRGGGPSGISGVVSTLNSITGSTADDLVGGGGVTPILSGNFVISSPNWNNSGQTKAGAATVGIGYLLNHFAVTPMNSMVGTFTNDSVSSGGVTPLTNSNFVVSSPDWGTTDIGASTWGSGIGGTVGNLG
ncbi:MAG: Cadherin proteinputative collagen-binding protein [Ilumatobacteraceae bacterium]|nr:Cadherin proteinputative collagen-binding protein [Ilumatobacteraceae bacterium]